MSKHPRDNGRYCKDCVHMGPGEYCQRPVSDYFDLVRGQWKIGRSLRDVYFERDHEETVNGNITIQLCGAEGRFYERKPVDKSA